MLLFWICFLPLMLMCQWICDASLFTVVERCMCSVHDEYSRGMIAFSVASVSTYAEFKKMLPVVQCIVICRLLMENVCLICLCFHTQNVMIFFYDFLCFTLSSVMSRSLPFDFSPRRTRVWATTLALQNSAGTHSVFHMWFTSWDAGTYSVCHMCSLAEMLVHIVSAICVHSLRCWYI